MFAKSVVALACGIASIAGCSGGADVVTIDEHQVEVPNVTPPTRLDVIMSFSDTETVGVQERCDDMGGHLSVRHEKNEMTTEAVVCEGVDY